MMMLLNDIKFATKQYFDEKRINQQRGNEG